MGLKRIRTDSVKELRRQKEELQVENERLRAQVADLEERVGEQEDALIELAGLLAGEEA